VAGLNEKSAVRVAGVRVGKVSEIRLTDDGRALVLLQIRDDVELYEDATARVASLGLLGEQYVQLIPGSPQAPPLPEEQEITLSGTSTATIDDVTNQVAQIADDLKAITASIRNSVGGPTGEERLEEIMENIRAVSESIRELVESNRQDVAATAENLRAITDELRMELPGLVDSLENAANNVGGTIGENREDVRTIVENLEALSSDLKITSENLGALTGQVRSGEGTVGKLIYSDEAHERLTGALEAVEGGVDQLGDTLGRINRLGLQLGIKGDYYTGLDEDEVIGPTLDGNSRTAVTLDLFPDPDLNRFYHLEVANDPHGDLDTKLIETTIIRPDGSTEQVTVREETVDRDLLISAQAGWRLDDFTVRVGLFDSTGGIGADYQFNDRTRLTGEAFDFGERRGEDPHLRVFGQYVLSREKKNFPQIFVSTGIDDPLNDRAWTFGGGIRWTDDDLKYLLGNLPTP
ncbi:MAG: MlaD family protein, partial [Thermoanaerobaculia bacterium]|nr:MlaD family protein [Thermoanaerobaculia bacterium]